MGDVVQTHSPSSGPTPAQLRSVEAHRRAVQVALRASELHERVAELQDMYVLHVRAAGMPEDRVAAAQERAADERERAATARAMAARHREALRRTYGLDA